MVKTQTLQMSLQQWKQCCCRQKQSLGKGKQERRDVDWVQFSWGPATYAAGNTAQRARQHTQTASSRYTNNWAYSQSYFWTVKGLPQKPYYTAAQTTGGFVELQDYPPNLLKEWNRTAIEGSTEEDHKVHQLRCDYKRANQFSNKVDHTICSLESSSASSEIFSSPLSLSLPLFCLLPFVQIHRKHCMLNIST